MSMIIQIGNIFTRASFSNPTVGRVYSVDGLSPTLNTNGGGYHLPMIIIEETENGENDIEDMENEIKVIGKISSLQDGVVVDADGIAPTHTSGHGNCPKIAEPYISAVRGREPNVLTPRRTEYGKAVRREYERGELREPRRNMQRFEPRIDNLGSYKPNGYNGSCVIGEGGIAPTVRENHGEVTAVKKHPKYRIRKLTPRECFRLMDVDDADIDKIQGAGICNSQQYKLAGNSIVVNVLYHIFRKMFVEQGNEEQQLKLF